VAAAPVFGGAVTSLGAMVFTLAEKEPKLLIETLQKFGPATFLGLVALVILDRGLKSGAAILREGTAAQQKLADAVQAISARDDERSREMELIVDHVARGMRDVKSETREVKKQVGEVVDQVAALRSELKEKAHGHSAGG
jgi:hypothetical protein